MFLNAGKTCLVKKYDLFRERDLCSYGVLKVRCVASGLAAVGGTFLSTAGRLNTK